MRGCVANLKNSYAKEFMRFWAVNQLLWVALGVSPEAKRVQISTNRSLFDAKVIQNGAIFVHCDAKLQPMGTGSSAKH